MRAYLGELNKRALAASTVARHLSAIRRFFTFLQTDAIREDNPAENLARPQTQRPLPKILSIDETQRLIDAAYGLPETSAAEKLVKARAVCLIEILYATGLRVSELMSLPRVACDSEMVALIVQGKGGRERLVPLSEPARQALRAWTGIRDAQPKAENSPFMFPASGRLGHLTRQRFAQILHLLAARRARKTPNFTTCASPCLCHTFGGKRRGFARRAANAGTCRYFHHADLHPCDG